MNIYYSVMSVIFSVYLAVSSLFYIPADPAVLNKKADTGSSTEQVTVMTYNVKTSGVGKYSVKNREPMLKERVERYMPDSVGFQEVNENWYEYLRENLTDYACTGEARDGGGRGEASPVFYLRDKYSLLDSGTFWLSATPDRVSKGRDAMYNRVCTYAVLRDKSTGLRYAHFNAHFDHIGIISRLEGVNVVIEKINEVTAKFGGIPVIFTGDLNDDEGSEMYERITGAGMSDTKFLAEKSEDTGTYHGYSALTEKLRTKPIDFVFINGGYKTVSEYSVDRQKTDGIYPSDHHPVIVKLTLTY